MARIDWYLDTARKCLDKNSDTELARFLGRSRELISQWRTGRCWPKSADMVLLANACGVDPRLALAELSSWKEPNVQQWKDLVDLFRATVSVLIVMVLVPIFSAHPASARELGTAASVYYGNWRRFLNWVCQLGQKSLTRCAHAA